MKSSFNQEKEGIVFAYGNDINGSYKALAEVCREIKYMAVPDALVKLDRIISMEMPIEFRKYNKHMGARHELGGKKGRYPVRAAKQVKVVLVNAIGNAKNYGLDGTDLTIVHACANKTRIERRYPPKGALAAVHGSYMGITPLRRMDLEFAKIEIGLAHGDEKGLTHNMKYFMKVKARQAEMAKKGKDKKEKKQAPAAKPKEPAKEKPKEAKKETAQAQAQSTTK